MELRSTFRNKQTEQAWQYKVRKEREEHYKNKSNIWDNIDLSLKKCKIRKVTRDQAKKVILEYEWLGTLPPASFYYGIFFENILGGVVCFVGNGAGASCAKMYGVKDREIGYLLRGACAYWTPKGSASKLISIALKLVKKDYPHIKLAIAFSDSDAGEYGTVYQATNWICLGKGNDGKSPSTEWVNPKGKILHNSITTDIARRNKTTNKTVVKYLLANGWKQQPRNAKCRYMYLLAKGEEGKRIYNRVKKYISKYPKRKNCLNGETVSRLTTSEELAVRI
tara:strand:- start:728 stop:1567 length:840 start_codon:yes stop_codon:yes gene_type:complete